MGELGTTRTAAQGMCSTAQAYFAKLGPSGKLSNEAADMQPFTIVHQCILGLIGLHVCRECGGIAYHVT